MLTVFCGNVGVKWPDVWVHRLARMVAENCSIPYRFICVSDHEIEGIDTLPASKVGRGVEKSNGCWVKLDYFRREYSRDGPCIAFDLDVTILSDISVLRSTTFASSCVDAINSSVLAWMPSAKTDALYTCLPPVDEYPQGDQLYFAAKIPEWVTLKGCYSYKSVLTEQTRETPPTDTVVVFFHGTPTPADLEVLRHSWNRRTWRGMTIENRTTQ